MQGTKRKALIGFGALVVAMFVIVAVAQGLGQPEPADDEIAIVEEAPEGTITEEEFDRALAQTAARQGLQDVPATDDPQYELIAEAATSDLILARWVAGEAEERGIEVSEREVDEELEAVKEQQFGSERAFNRFLRQSGFTPEEARERIRLQLLSDRIQETVLPQNPEVSESQVEAFYRANSEQFEQPETRDVRVVVTEEEAEAEAALRRLEEDDSPSSWRDVAREFSVDESTRRSGGLREGVVEGQGDPALDEEVFAALEGELVGPFETDAGHYVIQVEGITPARTTPLEEAREQIRQTLAAARQQEIAQAFQEDFSARWTARTFCAEGHRIDRCANAEPPPDPCTEELAETQGCDAPVPSIRPIEPGTASVFGAPSPLGRPQGPVTPQPEQAPGELPPGLIPQPGTPGTPPGAPPGTPPGSGAPPPPPGG